MTEINLNRSKYTVSKSNTMGTVSPRGVKAGNITIQTRETDYIKIKFIVLIIIFDETKPLLIQTRDFGIGSSSFIQLQLTIRLKSLS